MITPLLILSLLPFALFEKEGILTQNAMAHLRSYFVLWNVFLLFMSVSIVFGMQIMISWFYPHRKQHSKRNQRHHDQLKGQGFGKQRIIDLSPES